MPEKEKEDGKKTVPWEMTDPKPPVMQAGHRQAHREKTQEPVPGREGHPSRPGIVYMVKLEICRIA